MNQLPSLPYPEHKVTSRDARYRAFVVAIDQTIILGRLAALDENGALHLAGNPAHKIAGIACQSIVGNEDEPSHAVVANGAFALPFDSTIGYESLLQPVGVKEDGLTITALKEGVARAGVLVGIEDDRAWLEIQ